MQKQIVAVIIIEISFTIYRPSFLMGRNIYTKITCLFSNYRCVPRPTLCPLALMCSLAMNGLAYIRLQEKIWYQVRHRMQRGDLWFQQTDLEHVTAAVRQSLAEQTSTGAWSAASPSGLGHIGALTSSRFTYFVPSPCGSQRNSSAIMRP